MSGEHILSRAVLQELSGVEVRLDTSRMKGVFHLDHSQLKTKILCTRHNSAFSPIDDEAARFIRAFKTIHGALQTGHYDLNNRFFLFNGVDLERWLLKTLIATFKCGYSNVNKSSHILPPDIDRRLFDANWPPPNGLYLDLQRVTEGDAAHFQTENAYATQLVTYEKWVVGIRVRLFGVPIALAVGAPLNIDLSPQFGILRPSHLVFFKERNVFNIAFVWPRTGPTIFLSDDPNAEVPSGIV